MARVWSGEVGGGRGGVSLWFRWFPLGSLQVTIGYLRATVGHLWATVCHLKVTIGHLCLANTTELHPKVKPTCLRTYFTSNRSGGGVYKLKYLSKL